MAADLVPYSGPDTIVTSDAASKSVTINLAGGEGSAAKGFNFNGYGNGDMHVQVPTGWTVKVRFTDASSTPHSALIAPWEERQASSFHMAFTGSAGADYKSGIEQGDPPQTFTFPADKAGHYAIVCGVPGHDDLGMWDEFDVVDNLAAPQVLVKK
jgi:sulfocyanin